MSKYNAAIKSLAIALIIPNDQLPSIFAALNDDRYTLSRVKSFCYSSANRKYRHAEEKDFFAFIKALNILKSNQHLGVDQVDMQILLTNIVPNLISLIIQEILLTRPEDQNYVKQLQLFCEAYRDFQNGVEIFEGDKAIMAERLKGVLYAVSLNIPSDLERSIFSDGICRLFDLLAV